MYIYMALTNISLSCLHNYYLKLVQWLDTIINIISILQETEQSLNLPEVTQPAWFNSSTGLCSDSLCYPTIFPPWICMWCLCV